MSASLTTDQFRILRDARDGIAPAASWALRPKGYPLDVEQLVRENLVTSHHGELRLTPSGATRLKASLPAEPAQAD